MVYSSDDELAGANVVHVPLDIRDDPDDVAERVVAALDAVDPSGHLPVTLSVRVVPELAEGPRFTVVNSAEIAAQGGTLDARYWVDRLPGESVAAYRHRMLIEDIERRASNHEAQAAHLREAAEIMRAKEVR